MTTKTMTGGAAFLLLFALAACDSGPYDPSAHRRADAPTGSLLSGTDTGVDQNGNIGGNPSISTNAGSGAGAGK